MTGCVGAEDLPLDAGQALAIARRYAPLLLFHHAERHFPVDPAAFPVEARLRMSNRSGSRDAGYDRIAGRWVEGNEHAAAYYGATWDQIGRAIEAEVASVRPRPPDWCGDVTRPRDGRNLWRRAGGDGTRGFFLDLRNRDWLAGTGRADRPAPVFFDLYRITTPVPYLALTYWFFYAYNWHVALAHEGDWEHVTIYFPPDDDAFAAPAFAFFAQHGKGTLAWWRPSAAEPDRPCVSLEEGSHPLAFVSVYGHPTYHAVPAGRRPEWRTAWRTWDGDLRPVTSERWKDFDGAWGEVGVLVESTGPLGPWFKRRTDTVIVKKG